MTKEEFSYLMRLCGATTPQKIERALKTYHYSGVVFHLQIEEVRLFFPSLFSFVAI